MLFGIIEGVHDYGPDDDCDWSRDCEEVGILHFVKEKKEQKNSSGRYGGYATIVGESL